MQSLWPLAACHSSGVLIALTSAARRHLTPLSRHQRGLLRIILQNEAAAGQALQELNEVRLAQIVEERAIIQAEERIKEMQEGM